MDNVTHNRKISLSLFICSRHGSSAIFLSLLFVLQEHLEAPVRYEDPIMLGDVQTCNKTFPSPTRLQSALPSVILPCPHRDGSLERYIGTILLVMEAFKPARLHPCPTTTSHILTYHFLWSFEHKCTSAEIFLKLHVKFNV